MLLGREDVKSATSSHARMGTCHKIMAWPGKLKPTTLVDLVLKMVG